MGNANYQLNAVEQMPPELVAGLAELRAKAREADEFGNVQTARAIEWSIGVMERALDAASNAKLTLEEAVQVSGYTAGHLRRLVVAGELTNHGRDGAPLYRRSEIPVNPKRLTPPMPARPVKSVGAGQFDARGAVRRVLARSR
jgi:hypothetical protein